MQAHVIGDGQRSILELVEELNRDLRRGEGHKNVMARIKIDSYALDVSDAPRLRSRRNNAIDRANLWFEATESEVSGTGRPGVNVSRCSSCFQKSSPNWPLQAFSAQE